MTNRTLASEALLKRIQGQKDPRGPVGELARGKNVYKGVSNRAHSGGGLQYGRPITDIQKAARRRLERMSELQRKRNGTV